jgi:hypothetical protein
VSDLAAALMMAIRVHSAQTDRQGEPYLLHVLRVVEAVSDEAKAVAALHDMVEDGPAYVAAVVAEPNGLGLSGEEFNAVLRLTRRTDGETYEEYIRRIDQPGQGRVLAREVKIADLRDHMGRIPPSLPSLVAGREAREEWRERWKSLKARYEKAIATLEAGGKT